MGKINKQTNKQTNKKTPQLLPLRSQSQVHSHVDLVSKFTWLVWTETDHVKFRGERHCVIGPPADL